MNSPKLRKPRTLSKRHRDKVKFDRWYRKSFLNLHMMYGKFAQEEARHTLTLNENVKSHYEYPCKRYPGIRHSEFSKSCCYEEEEKPAKGEI